MQAPTTAEQFLELVKKSTVVNAADLDEFARRWRNAPEWTGAAGVLADAMVRDGLLSRFQAQQLLQGRHRNFILCGKYKILRPIGSGGMGQVFLCEHTVMRRQVAVKMLPLALSSNPTAVERFHREVRAMARLDHPNIVTAHDADREGGRLFLVMEYIDGKDLFALVGAVGAIHPHQAADYIRQAALGLQHAHVHGLVHRDIKPQNLLVDRTGTVKVLDLGLARFFHDDADDLSRRNDSSLLGTTDYVAPEQATDSHAADARADIYSLGATFYYLLAGQSPFHGKTPREKILAHQTQQPVPIRALRAEVPVGMASVLERMMAKDPGQRYQTAIDVAEALAPWDRSASSGQLLQETATPSDQATTAVTEVAALHPPSDGGEVPFAPPERAAKAVRTPEIKRDGRRSPSPPGQGPSRRSAAIVGAIAGVLVLAGAVALWQRGTGDRRSGVEPVLPAGAASEPVTPRLRLLVPAYFYPGGEGLAEWKRLLKAPSPELVVIIANPDSGPGVMPDENYVRVIDQAKEKGLTLIGYVSTRYAQRPPEEIREEVDRWVRLYPSVQGIFFDEQASAADRVEYYAALHEYARKQRGLRLVVGNPGTTCAEEYVSRPAADVVCLVESAKEFDQFRPPSWVTGYPAARFAAMLCKVDDPGRMKQDILRMADKHVGFCYVTDGLLPNPWDRLPGYWEAELAAVRQANERKGP